MKLEKIMTQFEAYFNPENELSSDCVLEGLRESLLRDMLIIGLNEKNLQERLLKESNLT